ncbi:ATP synthase subunit s, mitochondrial [Culicoides brevitarsis]|uniref:ATP synthase subunit s, mitochondrial n=1 Tax=Culicoides brevitarsis TaxID=469753 RepID=UPI00307B2798
MFSITKCLKKSPNSVQTRQFWGWVTMMFNRVDSSRIRKHGADRVCAEWLLRNGACVKFVGEQNLFCDYNFLPPDTIPFTRKIKEIYAKEAGINSNGFNHLRGLTSVDSVHIENCVYVDNGVFSNLMHVKETLKTLEVIDCQNISDAGLLDVKNLVNLRKFVAHNLAYVKDEKKVKEELAKALPHCELDIKVK